MPVQPSNRDLSAPDRWLPIDVASALVEYGHLDQARRHAARGDWHCAEALTQALLARDQVTAAMDVLTPFADRGHWKAVERLTDLLDAREQTDDAITLVRLHAAAGGQYAGLRLATLLARQGRTDDVLAILRPHVRDSLYAEALVSLTVGTGHDDEVAALLQTQIDARPEQWDPWWRGPANVDELLATVLERQGRLDEAVALLEAHLYVGEALFVNHVEALANLLARHGLEAQLRDLVQGAGGETASFRLALWLEEQSRADEAVEALRPFANAGSPNAAVVMAELLSRHGRTDEAIEVLRPILTVIPDPECVVDLLCDLLIRQGRPDEALAAIDDVATLQGATWTEIRSQRGAMLARCGRLEQAIAELRDGPGADTRFATQIADLLVDAGRLAEAIEVLRASDRTVMTSTHLARLLIRSGQVGEVVALFHDAATAKATAKNEQDAQFWHRFRAADQP